VELNAEAGGVPGRIVSKRDAIGEDICEVKVEGIESPLTVRQRANGAMRPGQDVFVILNPEHILVFDRD
jgi:iron(III) transport system ATP-binding protein